MTLLRFYLQVHNVLTSNKCMYIYKVPQVSSILKLTQHYDLLTPQVPRMLVTWAVHQPMVVEYHT